MHSTWNLKYPCAWVRLPALAPDSGFLLMQSLRVNGDGSSNSVPGACLGDLHYVPSSGFVPKPVPSAITTGIRGLSQQMGTCLLSLFLKWINNFFLKKMNFYCVTCKCIVYLILDWEFCPDIILYHLENIDCYCVTLTNDDFIIHYKNNAYGNADLLINVSSQ